MAQFEQKDLENLKSLCRIALTPLEEEDVLQSLKKVLSFVEQLNELDTEDLPPTTHVLNGMLKNILREDEVKQGLTREAFLANAPDQIGGMIRVPPIIKEIE